MYDTQNALHLAKMYVQALEHISYLELVNKQLHQDIQDLKTKLVQDNTSPNEE